MTDVLDGVTVSERDARSAARDDHTASTNRLAASLIRGFATRHRCHRERCLHRNHQRDTAYRLTLLEVLDLPDEQAMPSDYDQPLEWSSVTRSEAAALVHSVGGR